MRAVPAMLLAIALLSTACSEEQQPTPAGSSAAPAWIDTDITPEEADALIGDARLADGGSLDALTVLLGTEVGADRAEAALANGAEGDARWAAAYVYAASGTDPGPLRPLLDDRSASIRVLAAGGLLGMGDAGGFDVLVTELRNDEWMIGSHPLKRVGDAAAISLAAATGNRELMPDLSGDADEMGRLQAAWTEWLAENRDRLSYDADSRTWVAP